MAAEVAVKRHSQNSPSSSFRRVSTKSLSWSSSLSLTIWLKDEARTAGLQPQAGNILDAVLYRGELPRGDVPGIVGTGERQARRIVSALLDRGVLQSASTRAPLKIAFPARLAGRWMPGLFPEAAS